MPKASLIILSVNIAIVLTLLYSVHEGELSHANIPVVALISIIAMNGLVVAMLMKRSK